MKQGDLVVVDFPYSDSSGSKLRPAVVLSNEKYNRHANVLIAGLYGKRQPFSVRITNEDVRKGRLHKISYVSLQNVFSVDKSLFTYTFAGTLVREKVKEIFAEFARCV